VTNKIALPYKEKNIEKLYYTIGEVATLFKVTTSLIRFWENEFELLAPKKNKKGNRQYTQEDIDNLRLVYTLVKEKGYTLQGAKEILKTEKTKVKSSTEMQDSLIKVRAFLVDLKKYLD
jgi:DNA-binding transcriptional MerR regulator